MRFHSMKEKLKLFHWVRLPRERMQTEEKRKSRTDPWGVLIFRSLVEDVEPEKEKGQIRKVGAELETGM